MKNAKKDAELKAMQLIQQSPPQTSTPLETLIVQQLAEIVREERVLTERYRQLTASGESEVEMDIFSHRLSEFDQRANRLLRLVQAMEVC